MIPNDSPNIGKRSMIGSSFNYDTVNLIFDEKGYRIKTYNPDFYTLISYLPNIYDGIPSNFNGRYGIDVPSKKLVEKWSRTTDKYIIPEDKPIIGNKL